MKEKSRQSKTIWIAAIFIFLILMILPMIIFSASSGEWLIYYGICLLAVVIAFLGCVALWQNQVFHDVEKEKIERDRKAVFPEMECENIFGIPYGNSDGTGKSQKNRIAFKIRNASLNEARDVCIKNAKIYSGSGVMNIKISTPIGTMMNETKKVESDYGYDIENGSRMEFDICFLDCEKHFYSKHIAASCELELL